jgi:RNA polymerase sigma factor (sigma-70 family)
MADGSPEKFPKHLQTLFTSGAIGGLDDGALLERFVAGRDEAAFELLVARHGPMVLRVCRAALADPNDADDAFQAVFLVLVRRAVAIRSQASVASWLFGVASRVSARAKVDANRRRRHEQQAALGRPATAPTIDVEPLDAAHVLHEELARLPDRYRQALVLCYLEGQTCDAAAAQLRRPVGTIKARLSRARGIMKRRLLRRGVTLPAGLLAVGTSVKATAAPLPLSPERVALAVSSAAPARVLVLAEGVLKSMLLQKIKLAALSLTAVFAVGVVLVAWGASQPGDEPPPRVVVKSAKAAAGAGSPEEVFAQAMGALDRDRIEEFVALLHPEAVKQLRATVTATAEALAGEPKADPLFTKFTGAKSVGELKTLDDRRFAAKYLGGLIQSLPLFKLTLATTMGEVLGHVDDGKENVYVVYRSTVDDEGAIRDQLNVARLRKDGSKWAMELPERIGMFIETQKRSSAGDPPVLPELKEQERASQYEPVGRLVTGGDSAHVVLRQATPVGYFTRVLTVKKSALGWDEALAGKPEGLAKLVRAKLHRLRPTDAAPPAAFGADTPEAVLSQAFDALNGGRIADFVKLMHPDAVKQLRTTVTTTAEKLAGQGMADGTLVDAFPEIKAVGDLKNLDDRQFVTGYLRKLFEGFRKLKLTMAWTKGEILGHVDEGAERVQVVFRSTTDAKGASRDKLNVAGLRKDGARWAVEIPDALAMFFALGKQAAAGTPVIPEMNAVKASRVEPVGRFLAGSDTAYVVFRLVTTVGKMAHTFTRALTVKKSDLGWDEALAGKAEGLAKLVRADFGLDPSADEEPLPAPRKVAAATPAAKEVPPATVAPSFMNKAILARLERPVTRKYANATPLERVVSDVVKDTQGPNDAGIPIYFDPIGLDSADKRITAPVTLDADGVPLKDALSRLLTPLGLAYCVYDGLLIVSDSEQIDKNFKTVPVIARDQSPETRAVLAVLEKPIALKYLEATPLERVIADIRKVTRGPKGAEIPIYVDPVGLEELEQAMIASRVTVDLAGIPLRTTLRLLVKQLFLDYYIDDGLLIITPPVEDGRNFTEDPTFALDRSPATMAVLAKLEQPIAMKYPDETPLEDVLANIRKATKGPDDTGIPIHVDPVGLNELEKTMTSPVKMDVEGIPLRRTLRLMLAQLGLDYGVENGLLIVTGRDVFDEEFGKPGLIARDKSPGTKAVLSKLEQPVAMKYPDETPLERVIADIVAATKGPNDAGIPIYVDPDGLDKAEKTMTSLVTMDVAGVPLRTTLRLLLGQLGLSYSVHDGLLIVSDPDDIDWWLLDEPSVIVFDRSPGTRAILAKLKQPVGLDYSKDTPLQEVVSDLTKASGIPIGVDPAGLKVVEETMASTVHLAGVKGVPLRTALWLLLKQLGLAYYVENDRLTISDQESVVNDKQSEWGFKKAVIAGDRSPRTTAILIKLEQPIAWKYPDEVPLKQVVWDITKATQGPNGAGLPIYVSPLGFNSVEQTMNMLVAPAFPEGTRSPLRVSLRLLLNRLGMDFYVQDGLVIVTGADLVDDDLRKAPVVALDQSPGTRAVLARLDQPIAMKYPGLTPLDRVISDIREATQAANDPGIPIELDSNGLQAAGKTLSAPVTIDLVGVPLRTTLRLMLGQLGLDYYVEDGRLRISDDESVEAKRVK